MEAQQDFKELLELFNKHGVYINREQLIKNKKATGRKRDIADLESLGEE